MYQDQKKNIDKIKKSVSSISDENEVFLKELNAMRTEFEHLNDIVIDFCSDRKTASWTLIRCGIATPLFER